MGWPFNKKRGSTIFFFQFAIHIFALKEEFISYVELNIYVYTLIGKVYRYSAAQSHQ